MDLTISPKAHEWFQSEMGAKKGDAIRIFGKYGGNTSVHNGFSTGIRFDQPEDILAEEKIADIYYYIEKADDWFFHGLDLVVDFDDVLEEPTYNFSTSGSVAQK